MLHKCVEYLRMHPAMIEVANLDMQSKNSQINGERRTHHDLVNNRFDITKGIGIEC
ncbi:MAG: hypothetical protein WA395_05125 [Nitrososphaeraceae archaeon]